VNEQENRERLAQAVKAARMRLYRTVDRARITAGVSRGTWDSIEQGKPVKEFSLGPVEEALGWPQGRALAILAGEDGESATTGRDELREAARAARDAGLSRDDWIEAYDAEVGRREVKGA
jgi:hypothetical protein